MSDRLITNLIEGLKGRRSAAQPAVEGTPTHELFTPTPTLAGDGTTPVEGTMTAEQFIEREFGWSLGWQEGNTTTVAAAARMATAYADYFTRCKLTEANAEIERLKKQANAAEDDLMAISKALNQKGSHVAPIADRAIAELLRLQGELCNCHDFLALAKLERGEAFDLLRSARPLIPQREWWKAVRELLSSASRLRGETK